MIIKEIDRYRESITDPNGFLNQARLSFLDWHILPNIIDFKMEIQSILLDLKFGIVHIQCNEEPSIEKVGNLVFSMIESAIKASKNIVPLIKYSKSIRKRGLLGNISIWQ